MIQMLFVIIIKAVLPFQLKMGKLKLGFTIPVKNRYIKLVLPFQSKMVVTEVVKFYFATYFL